jgi:hypothetical protein
VLDTFYNICLAILNVPTTFPSFNFKEQVVDDGFWWSGEMCRDKKEHQLLKHYAQQNTNTKRLKLGEQMGLHTSVVLTINDGY